MFGLFVVETRADLVFDQRRIECRDFIAQLVDQLIHEGVEPNVVNHRCEIIDIENDGRYRPVR